MNWMIRFISQMLLLQLLLFLITILKLQHTNLTYITLFNYWAVIISLFLYNIFISPSNIITQLLIKSLIILYHFLRFITLTAYSNWSKSAALHYLVFYAQLASAYWMAWWVLVEHWQRVMLLFFYDFADVVEKVNLGSLSEVGLDEERLGLVPWPVLLATLGLLG